MGVPTVYRNSKENSIASYSWTDINTGIGYINHYFTYASNGRILTKASIGSAAMDAGYATRFIAASNTDIKVTSAALTKQIILQGAAYVSFIVRNMITDGDATVTMTLQKYDGSTYTNISDAVTMTIATLADSDYSMVSYLTVIGEQPIKSSEYIVLNVTTNTRANVLSNSTANTCFISIPYKINL